MANLFPFRGVLYDPTIVGDLAKVVAPPYDVIDSEYQRTLHARHPHNIIRLELGLAHPDDDPSHNRYTRAAAWLSEWLGSGVLRRDANPAVYFYTVDYRPPDESASKLLKGFLSTVVLEEFGTGRIFPHENTRSAAKADRLELLKTCRANFSPIFSLFSDPDGAVLRLLETSIDPGKPRLDFLDDCGFRQRLWAVTDQAVLDTLVTAMNSKPLFIADGHHRYETALSYQRLRRIEPSSRKSGSTQTPHPYDCVLMLFSSLEDPGLTVLPTHRVLTTPVPPFKEISSLLGKAFEIEELDFQDDSEVSTRMHFLQSLRARGRSGTVFGLATHGTNAYVLLTLRPAHAPAARAPEREKLDVSILQTQILNLLCPMPADQEAMLYTKDDDEALDLVRQGTAQAALLLNPTKVAEVRAVAASGGRMPHKSTYFFPKPLTGLVLNVMEEE